VTAIVDTLLWPAVALVAGAFALAPLGLEVLRRGIVFIDLAIAQAAAVAMLVVQTLLHQDASPVLTAFAGLAGAGVTVIAVHVVVSPLATGKEAAVGLLYVIAAGLGLVVAHFDVHGASHFAQLLSGDVLWASREQAIILSLLALAVGGLTWAGRLGVTLVFYLAVTGVIVPAVMVLGLLPVFALLIGPAAWRGVEHGPLAAGVAAAGLAIAGLGLSAWADTPSGPTIAVTVAAVSLILRARTLRRMRAPGHL